MEYYGLESAHDNRCVGEAAAPIAYVVVESTDSHRRFVRFVLFEFGAGSQGGKPKSQTKAKANDGPTTLS
jgi:hypothetical protein